MIDLTCSRCDWAPPFMDHEQSPPGSPRPSVMMATMLDSFVYLDTTDTMPREHAHRMLGLDRASLLLLGPAASLATLPRTILCRFCCVVLEKKASLDVSSMRREYLEPIATKTITFPTARDFAETAKALRAEIRTLEDRVRPAA